LQADNALLNVDQYLVPAIGIGQRERRLAVIKNHHQSSIGLQDFSVRIRWFVLSIDRHLPRTHHPPVHIGREGSPASNSTQTLAPTGGIAYRPIPSPT